MPTKINNILDIKTKSDIVPLHKKKITRAVEPSKDYSIPELVTPVEDTLRVRSFYYAHNVEMDEKVEKPVWADTEEIKITRRCSDGIEQGPATFIRFLWTLEKLLFYVEVERPDVNIVNDDLKLWQGSNIEFLLAPRWFVRPFYDEYEFLFNSNGGINDLRWNKNKNQDEAISWHAEGLQWTLSEKLTFHKDMKGWSFEGQIPFEAFRAVTPSHGDYWGLGLYRTIRLNDSSQQLLAWSPTFTNPASFHAPSRFGMMLFDKT